MINETVVNSTLFVVLKYVVLLLLPFVEPQLAGILGGMAYLIVRHELNLASLSIKSIIIVMFFGWLGAWATVNIINVEFVHLEDVYIKLLSATAGFLSYDAMLAFGQNSKSVVGFLGDTLKTIIGKVVDKWK